MIFFSSAVLNPQDFISELASLIPKPRVNLTLQEGNKTAEGKRRAMTSFCSCKTGIYAIHGKNLGSTVEKGVQY